MYNKQHYKNVRHQVTRRAQIWLKKLRHLDAIQVLFVSLANESPVYVVSTRIPWVEKKRVTHGPTDRPTDGPTDGQTLI